MLSENCSSILRQLSTSLNELKSSIALELKLLHSQEFMKIFPLPHYFKISTLPSVASAIQTNDLSQDMILQQDNATPNKIHQTQELQQ